MKKLFISILALTTLASCEKTKNSVQPINTGEQEIQLVAGITKMEVTSKAAVNDATFLDNTEIGLYAIKKPQTGDIWVDGTTEYPNDGTTTITANKISVSQSSGEKKFYYPTDDQPIVFFACYPKGTPEPYVQGNAAPNVTFDLSAEDQPDIMYVMKESGTLSKQSEVALNFEHKLAKIGFKVKAGTGFQTGITVTQVKISGATKATLNMGTGTLTCTAETPTKDIVHSSLTQAIGIEATTTPFGITLLAPNTTYNLTVTAGGIDYEASLTTPAAGKAQNIVLTFDATEMSATTSITKWEDLGDQNDTHISKQ